MSWAVAATVGIAAGTTLYQTNQAKKAEKKAKREALEDRLEARRAEVYAETEGEGVGSLGEVRLGIDEEIDEDEDLLKGKRSSNLVI